MVMEEEALSAVADRYVAALSTGTVQEIDIRAYDRLAVPSIAAVFTSPAEPAPAHSTGFGASTAAARVGALGELSEGVLVNRAVAALTPEAGNHAEMCARYGADLVVDPVTLVLEAGSDYSADRPLLWVPMTRWRTGETVRVPMEFVASEQHTLPAQPPPGGWLTTAITNGLGAGDSLERAMSHALLEIIQRDGDTVCYRALDTGVVIDLSTSTDPQTVDLLAAYARQGVQPLVKLAESELATVVFCTGIDSVADTAADTGPLAVTAIGEAAALDPTSAIRKALLEYASSRVRKAFAFGSLDDVAARHPDYLQRELSFPLVPQEDRAVREMQRWSSMSAAQLSDLVAPTLYRTERIVPLESLGSGVPVTDPAVVLTELLRRLEDFDVLYLAAGEQGGIRAVKVLVPGLEVETMSYLRIGERVLRRLLERDSELVGLGAPATADQLPIHLSAAATQRIGDTAWFDRSVVARLVGGLYPLYREPDRFAMQRLARGERPAAR
jgi:YcaO-like protein with predicted kinase domain